MHRRIPGSVDLVPTRHGWSMDVHAAGDSVRRGSVRVPDILTWMQQRRAIEERLRSWGYLVSPDVEWTREADGRLRLPLVPTARAA